VTTTTSAVCTAALQELNLAAAGETPPARDLLWAAQKLNRILDNWNADRKAVYAERQDDFTLTPGLNPIPIGPTGTFVMAQRPVTIDGAAILQNSGTQLVQIPLRMVDYQWWIGQPAPNVESSLPSNLYYEPAWPNGHIYLWPVAQTAYDLRLQTRVVLGELALTDDFTLPPGYWDAITLTLAEDLAPSFGQQAPPSLAQKAQQARARVFANNTTPKRIATHDSGMPRSGRLKNNFLWKTGGMTR
jgi:hypothetical protein